MNTPPANPDEEIFQAALALPGAERPAYLDAACGEDHALRGRVEVLLASHEASEFMLEPATVLTAELTEQFTQLKPEEEGERIGHYKLLQQIGEGGFGTVWMAEQEQPVRRRVALKILKPGMDTREVVARFEQERQALAMMDHSNIARVFDAGATQWGRPFFVMELVRGTRITDYCDEAKLPTRERLELFMQVCRAVQHAHQKGVIHRDLKPSNILVTLHDGVPVPKVIDFGIAKAIQHKQFTDLTFFTRFEQMLGTPLYMSPEQAEMSGLDVDTRSDIYSLGVLLYELLTGRTPFDPLELMQAGRDELRRVIREQEPKKPSTALQTMAENLRTSVAASRHTDARTLTSLVRGDLDWIVMKALEKDRSRRYAGTGDLAADIERHLRNEPISAHPPGTAYLLGKLIRRHKAAFAAGAAVALALVLGIAGTTWGLMQARTSAVAASASADKERMAKVEARTEAAVSRAVNEFITTDLFGTASPNHEPDRDLKVRTVLDRAAARIGNRFKDQPRVEASILMTLAQTYGALGEFEKALKLAERSVELKSKDFGLEHPHTLSAKHDLAIFYSKVDRLPEALKLREEVLALSRKVNGVEHPDTLEARGAVALSHFELGRPEEALSIFGELLPLARRVNGNEAAETLNVMHNMALACLEVRRPDEGLSLLEEVLQIERKVFGPERPDTLRTMHNLAIHYDAARRHDEALTLREQLLPLRKTVLGRNHPDTINAMQHLAISFTNCGRPKEGTSLLEETLTLCRAELPPEHSVTLDVMHNLALAYRKDRRWDDAIKLREEVLEVRRKTSGNEHLETLEVMGLLAESFADAGRLHTALELEEEVLTLRRKVQGLKNPETLAAMHNLAISYNNTNRLSEALKLQEELLPLRQEVLGRNHPDTIDAMQNLAMSYSEDRRRDKGTKLLEEAVALGKALPPEHAIRILSMHNLAQNYREDELWSKAIELQREVLELRRSVNGREHPDTLHAMHALAFSYAALGNFQDAIPLQEEVLGVLRGANQADPSALASARDFLAELYEKQGQKPQADSMRKEIADGTAATPMQPPPKSAPGVRGIKELKTALDRARETAPEAPDTITKMIELAAAYGADGNWGYAIKFGKEALALARKLPKGDARILAAMKVLIPAYKSVDLDDEARTLEVEVRALTKETQQ